MMDFSMVLLVFLTTNSVTTVQSCHTGKRALKNATFVTDNLQIIEVDMSEEMQRVAVDIADQALYLYTTEKEIATFIKKEFDKRYNPTWHCIVGRGFGGSVAHETKQLFHFDLGKAIILLYKYGCSS